MKLVTGKWAIPDSFRFRKVIVDPYKQETIDDSLSMPQNLPYIMPPLTRLLIHTQEIVRVPELYIGHVELRSTFARLGLILPPTYADPGFEGTLTLEVFNASQHSIIIHPNMHFAEMVLVSAPFEPLYEGRYQGQGDEVVVAKAIERG